MENKYKITFDKFHRIGTIVGITTESEFEVTLLDKEAQIGDFVVVLAEVPIKNGDIKEKTVITVGKITNIQTKNDFFPDEIGYEIAESNINIDHTPLSNEFQSKAQVQILGFVNAEDINDKSFKYHTLLYPVKAGKEVKAPDTIFLKKFLAGNIGEHPLYVGDLVGRPDVNIEISGQKLTSRHLAVLGKTGSGKTVGVRRILSELINKKFPLIIFDRHGDYIPLFLKRKYLQSDVKIFYPKLKADSSIIEMMIKKLGYSLTDPQQDCLDALIGNLKYKSDDIKQFIESLTNYANAVKDRGGQIKDNETGTKYGASTLNVVIRSLRFVKDEIESMMKQNESNREKYKQLEFDEMPDPKINPEELISKGQVSIFYLAGYKDEVQSAIVAYILEALFKHRTEKSPDVPPFQAVIEEAHNFIPSSKSGNTNLPSTYAIKKIAQEGRKFGCGLTIVSQRPSLIDQTVLSQCNSFMIFGISNPQDIRYLSNVMEYFEDSDVRSLTKLSIGESILAGQFVKFPLRVSIKHDKELENDFIGNENFINEALNWGSKENDEKLKEKKEKQKGINKILNTNPFKGKKEKISSIDKLKALGLTDDEANAIK